MSNNKRAQFTRTNLKPRMVVGCSLYEGALGRQRHLFTYDPRETTCKIKAAQCSDLTGSHTLLITGSYYHHVVMSFASGRAMIGPALCHRLNKQNQRKQASVDWALDESKL